VALALALLAVPALAEEAAPWSFALARELMSPYCPGRSLADCPSQQADTLRLWIQMQEAAGRSREDVEAELVQRYGDAILPAPRAQGFGLAAYLLPALAFVLGGVLVVVFLRRQGAPPEAPESAPEAVSDPQLERLVDQELARGEPGP
jgi:cytochrome c-type biogenesis protein CcmH/NrfF